MKKWAKYLILIIAILAVNYLRNYFGWKFNVDFKSTFKFNMCYYALGAIMTVIIGVVLGAEHFVNELKKEGKWKINIPKLVLVGLPSLYFTSTYIMMYSKVQILWNIAKPVFKIATTTQTAGFFVIFQIILGYVLITSFYKDNTVKRIESSENSEQCEL